jgi:hypothetical protein
MNHKKKHQKRLINLSGIVLFLLVLNINFTLTFTNFEFNNAEDNYEENYGDLSPELIVESPKNAGYLYHLDFMPYGTYIHAPKYIQRFIGQSSLNNIYFRLYDANEGSFSKFRVYVDGVSAKTEDWPSNEPYFDIGPYLSANGVHTITAQALSDKSHKWVTHDSILNVTPTIPCITPFYDDFLHTQGAWGNLDWNSYTSNSGQFNYSIYINSTEAKIGENLNSGDSFDFTFYDDINFDTSVDAVNEIRLEITDNVGEKSINLFKITNIADSVPNIESLYRNCENENFYDLTLMETEGFTISASAYSDQNDLEKIVIIVNNLPIYTIDNVDNFNDYETPINTYSLMKLLYDYGYNDYGYIRNNLEFTAIAVNKDGRGSPLYDYENYQPVYIDAKFYDFYQLIKKTENVSSGRNVETLTMTEEYNSDIEYSLTVVTDFITPTTLTIAGSTGEPFENMYGWDHCYEDNRYDTDNVNCQLFGGYDTDQGWYRGGMVFWVGAENQSAVQFPMIVKITYPEEIQPDELNNIWNLQFMHWVDNCETNERGWYIYQNETISENRDETLKDVGDNAIEVLIYSQGLYAFGMEPGEDYDSGGLFISSFPIGLILFSFGIAAITISLKTKFKIKKK